VSKLRGHTGVLVGTIKVHVLLIAIVQLGLVVMFITSWRVNVIN